MIKRIAAFPAVLLLVLVAACTQVKHDSVPEALLGSVTVEGVANLRNWADEFSGNGEALTQNYAEALRAHLDANDRQFDILTLSGGGQSGAYGAGLLNGWTASGTRPQFQIVTGVLSRSAPALNLFALGLPAGVLAGLAALIAALPIITDQMVDLSGAAITETRSILLR